jgi:Leucine-rich repeat (LRR) protein
MTESDLARCRGSAATASLFVANIVMRLTPGRNSAAVRIFTVIAFCAFPICCDPVTHVGLHQGGDEHESQSLDGALARSHQPQQSVLQSPQSDTSPSSPPAAVRGSPTVVTASTSTCPERCDCFNNDETVDCSRRELDSFPSVGNATRRLYVEDNRLATLANAGLRSATSLSLLVIERNFVDHVDVFDAFCGLIRLQELNLGANRIRAFVIGRPRRSSSSAAAGGRPATSTASSTGGDELTDCRLPALKEINLGLNLLAEIPRNLSAFAPNLEILNLGYNEIERATLDSSFSELVALRYLDLSRNRIHELDDFDLRPAAFVVPLEVLSLTECGLVTVSERAFAGLVNLTSLTISNNPIWIWSFGPALRNLGTGILDDSGGSIESNATVTHAVGVRASDVSTTNPAVRRPSTSIGERPSEYTPLPPPLASPSQLSTTLSSPSPSVTSPLVQFAPLTRLDLSEIVLPNLTVDALGRFVNLIVLDASYCELEYVEPGLFDRLPNVETLHLEGGKLERVENLAALRRLRRLHLQENRLSVAVDLRGLYSLEMVDLSRNRIETIPGVWLVNLRNLQVLNLSHNMIRIIEPDSFHEAN